MRPCDPSDSMYLSDSGIDLLKRLFNLNPDERICAADALKHAWFQENPQPVDTDKMPVFPEMNKVSRD